MRRYVDAEARLTGVARLQSRASLTRGASASVRAAVGFGVGGQPSGTTSTDGGQTRPSEWGWVVRYETDE